VSERMLAILLTGGVEPQSAAWATDALLLYVSAYALELAVVARRRAHQEDDWVVSRDELVRRFSLLPADQFPQTRRYAVELTSGSGHERFDFALGLIVDNLTGRGPGPSGATPVG